MPHPFSRSDPRLLPRLSLEVMSTYKTEDLIRFGLKALSLSVSPVEFSITPS